MLTHNRFHEDTITKKAIFSKNQSRKADKVSCGSGAIRKNTPGWNVLQPQNPLRQFKPQNWREVPRSIRSERIAPQADHRLNPWMAHQAIWKLRIRGDPDWTPISRRHQKMCRKQGRREV